MCIGNIAITLVFRARKRCAADSLREAPRNVDKLNKGIPIVYQGVGTLHGSLNTLLSENDVCVYIEQNIPLLFPAVETLNGSIPT